MLATLRQAEVQHGSTSYCIAIAMNLVTMTYSGIHCLCYFPALLPPCGFSAYLPWINCASVWLPCPVSLINRAASFLWNSRELLVLFEGSPEKRLYTCIFFQLSYIISISRKCIWFKCSCNGCPLTRKIRVHAQNFLRCFIFHVIKVWLMMWGTGVWGVFLACVRRVFFLNINDVGAVFPPQV